MLRFPNLVWLPTRNDTWNGHFWTLCSNQWELRFFVCNTTLLIPKSVLFVSNITIEKSTTFPTLMAGLINGEVAVGWERDVSEGKTWHNLGNYNFVTAWSYGPCLPSFVCPTFRLDKEINILFYGQLKWGFVS